MKISAVQPAKPALAIFIGKNKRWSLVEEVGVIVNRRVTLIYKYVGDKIDPSVLATKLKGRKDEYNRTKGIDRY